MTPLRIIVFGSIGFLVLAPLLGFAAGAVAPHIWDTHPRQAAGQPHDTSRVAWKSTPGTTETPRPRFVLALLGWLAPSETVVAMPALFDPPFVPPRA